MTGTLFEALQGSHTKQDDMAFHFLAFVPEHGQTTFNACCIGAPTWLAVANMVVSMFSYNVHNVHLRVYEQNRTRIWLRGYIKASTLRMKRRFFAMPAYKL